MGLSDVFESVREVIGPRRVYGEPVERGETTVIPAATVIGAGGGGGGEGIPPGTESDETGTGGGIGFALLAWPSGAYEIRDGGARWIPALDISRLAVLGVVLVALLLRSRHP